jgi:DNA topoisomerase IA
MTIDPLSFGLANVNLVLRVVDGVQKLVDKANESNPDLGKLYDSVKKLISNRTYLSPSTPFEGTGLEDEYEDKGAVEESPAVQAIQRLYEHPSEKELSTYSTTNPVPESPWLEYLF